MTPELPDWVPVDALYVSPGTVKAQLRVGSAIYADPCLHEVEHGDDRLTPEQARRLALLLMQAADLAEGVVTAESLAAGQ